MLRRNQLLTVSSLSFALATAAFAGCTVKSVDTNNHVDTSTTTTSTTTTGTGGGGAGTGTGGTGGTTTTTTGTGGTGGTACVGPDGTGKTASLCETMNITPPPNGGAAKICDGMGGIQGDQNPPGYDVCIKGFDLFTTGAAEDLEACLALISVAPADACDPAQADACVQQMYADACPNPTAIDACDQIAAVCGQDPFDAALCKKELNPFNQTSLETFGNCFNADQTDPCQTAYETCINSML